MEILRLAANIRMHLWLEAINEARSNRRHSWIDVGFAESLLHYRQVHLSNKFTRHGFKSLLRYTRPLSSQTRATAPFHSSQTAACAPATTILRQPPTIEPATSRRVTCDPNRYNRLRT